jgi:hypothetical protein
VTPAEPPAATGRFPGFDALSQTKHWDDVTAGVVLSRIGMPPDIRFFTPAEQAAATALCDQLLDQSRDSDHQGRVPVANMIDARLAAQQTDGWRYHDMPEDGQAWRDSLVALDREARDRFDADFAACSAGRQATLIQAVQDLGSSRWHDMRADHEWSLWTRYASTAFYSHPTAWNELGFPGPAYPRGYKNPGIDSREPFEVRDARPGDDPTRDGR